MVHDFWGSAALAKGILEFDHRPVWREKRLQSAKDFLTCERGELHHERKYVESTPIKVLTP